MHPSQMTKEEIQSRLAALADELVQAQGALATLLDGGTAGVGQYVKAQGTVELLKAEQTRLAKTLPFAIQAELDAAEKAADDLSTAAAAALKARRAEVATELRRTGFAKATESELKEILEQHDDIEELRGQHTVLGNLAHKASMAAARHRGELPRQA